MDLKPGFFEERNLKALYRFMMNNAEFYEEEDRLQRIAGIRLLEHGVFYTALSDVKIDTGLISDKAVDLLAESNSDNELTMDHIFSPQRYARYFFKNIMNMSFEEFLTLIVPLCCVIKVTKKENNELMNLEKRNKKNNKFVIDKYEQMGITISRGYYKYNKIPDDILDTMPSILKEMNYDYDI